MPTEIETGSIYLPVHQLQNNQEGNTPHALLTTPRGGCTTVVWATWALTR